MTVDELVKKLNAVQELGHGSDMVYVTDMTVKARGDSAVPYPLGNVLMLSSVGKVFLESVEAPWK